MLIRTETKDGLTIRIDLTATLTHADLAALPDPVRAALWGGDQEEALSGLTFVAARTRADAALSVTTAPEGAA